MENTLKIITKNEIVIRFTIILFVISLLFHSNEEQLMWIRSIGFLLAFFLTAYLHRYFFPFTMLAIGCFFSASTNELFGYVDAAFTKTLWAAGDIFLPIGICSFIYRLAYKYKIEND